MSKLRFSDDVSFIDIELFKEKRFAFVNDDVLKTNLSIAGQYIAFLHSLEKTYEVPGPIRYSIYKTIIIYAASIVESLLIHGLRDLVDLKTMKEGLRKEYKNIHKICPISDLDCIIWGNERIEFRTWENLSFQDLNRIASREELISEALFEKCENLRKNRNKIHIATVQDGDDFFEVEDIENIFVLLGEIIEVVKGSLLSTINHQL